MRTLMQEVPGSEQVARNRRRAVMLLVVLVVIGGVGLWVWDQGSERRAVSKLLPDERVEIYRRELDNFRTLCGPGPRADALEEQCRTRAKFILEFPECDDECQRLAQSHLVPRGRVK